jgi:chromate reductase, NAD(P)H dehydrogenase (quinone)
MERMLHLENAMIGQVPKFDASGANDQRPNALARAVRILGISGSLRARSSNTELLRAVSLVAPSGVHVTLFFGLDTLPHFNPDLDGEGAVPPPRIGVLRQFIRRADALLICSPEYAHGVPGVLKNVLDWLVSVPDLPYKPVGLLNAAPRSTHAQASLAETLRTMSMAVIPGASIAVPVIGRALSAAAMADDPELAAAMRGVLQALIQAAIEYRTHQILAPSGSR